MNRHLMVLCGLAVSLFVLLLPPDARAFGPDIEDHKWRSYPVTVVIGKAPLHAYNGAEISKAQLTSFSRIWNDAGPASVLVVPVSSCVTGDRVANIQGCPTSGSTPPTTNGRNEVNFNYYPASLPGLHLPDGLNAATASWTVSGSGVPEPPPPQPWPVDYDPATTGTCVPLPNTSGNPADPKRCGKALGEADVYFNYRNLSQPNSDATNFYGSRRPSSCRTEVSAYEIMIHEIGHMIGLGHALSNQAATRPNYVPCHDFTRLKAADIESYFRTFFNTQLSLRIAAPQNGDRLLPGVISFRAINPSAGTRGALPEPQWDSDLDGELGTGFEVAAHLGPGTHRIRSTISDPATGAEISDVVVVTVIEDAASQGGLFPVPCIRMAGDGQGRCLLRYAQRILLPDSCQFYSSEYYSYNDAAGMPFDIVQNNTNTVCVGNNRWIDPEVFSWLHSADSEIPAYRFSHVLFRHNQWTNTFETRGVLPLVDTNIDIDADLVCQPPLSSEQCDLSVAWNNHYFDVSTGLYMRDGLSNDWQFIQSLQELSGSISFSVNINHLPADIAIFQYSEDFGVIDAPAGLLFGPAPVELASGGDEPVGTLGGDGPCTLTSSIQNCTVSLGGTKSNTPLACIWVGSGDSLAVSACHSADTFSFDWPHANTNCCDLTLKAHDSNPFDNPNYARGNATAHALFNGSTTLDTEPAFGLPDNGGGTPVGTLSASNAPCIIAAGEDHCSVNLTATKANAPWACTWVGSGSELAVHECFDNSSFELVWPHANSNCCELTLKAHDSPPFYDPDYARGNATAHALFNNALTLDTAHAFGFEGGEPSGTLVSDSPCVVPVGSDSCTVNLQTSHSNTPLSCLWRTTPSLPVARVGCTQIGGASQGTYAWPHARPGSTDTFELLAHSEAPANTANGYATGMVLATLATTATVGEPAQDDYEDDDTYHNFSAYEGVPQTHHFGDDPVDWIGSYNSAYHRRTYETYNLGPSADTCIWVFGADSAGNPGLLLGADCDSGTGNGSRLVLDQPEGSYLIMVDSKNSVTGPGTEYTFRIQNEVIDGPELTGALIGGSPCAVSDGQSGCSEDATGNATASDLFNAAPTLDTPDAFGNQ